MVAVYSSPLPDTAPAEPPSTVTSSVLKPVTPSEKVKVAVNDAVLPMAAGTPVIDSVGGVASHVALADTALAGPVRPLPVAAPALTVTTASEPPAGVTTSVYRVALAALNVPFAPPATVTSSVVKPVTA